METIDQPQTITRCYRYALAPSAVQREAIFAAARVARRYWNSLVACQRHALHEIEHGRRGSVASALTELLLVKKLTGGAVVKARPRAETDGISLEQAAHLNRIDQSREASKCEYTKKGFFLRKEVQSQARHRLRDRKCRSNPQEKRRVQNRNGARADKKVPRLLSVLHHRQARGTTIQADRRFYFAAVPAQHGSSNPISGDRVRLDKLAGDMCSAAPAILHRPIPETATIKQVALTIRGPRMFAVLMLDLVGQDRQYAATGQVAGIDPGRKMALSLSNPDQTVTERMQPPLARHSHVLKRLRRLQRKAARQLRAANPDCFNADGTFKRGKRPKNKSNNFRRASQQVLDAQEHIANARSDYYHNAANQLLSAYDVIGVGTWRGKGNAPGEGKAKRAQNRKDYDHAISSFVSILEYKADECGKQVFDVPEHGSTKRCSYCRADTGPTGLEGLKVREWTCRECGPHHDRDFQAAAEIARRAQRMAGANSRPR